MKKIKIHFSKYVAGERKDIAGLLLNAVNSLVESEENFLEAIRQVVEYYEDETGCYPLISFCKDDLREAGFNPDSLSNDDMRNFANKMSTEDMMDPFWFALAYAAENDIRLPELRTEIDSLYETYKREYGEEPLYATIWLEDRDVNNGSWPETVKLTLDVVEQEDDRIYMYFDGYSDLKEWLYSTLDDNSLSEDCWCYGSPEQRIVFTDKLCSDEI